MIHLKPEQDYPLVTSVRRENSKRHKNERRTIVAIDGEGETRGDKHYYTLLMASTGAYSERRDELTTEECFTFLLNLPNGVNTDYLFVGFSINYDINMWLRDLPKLKLHSLIEHGFVLWHQYKLRYKPNKTFSIEDRRTRKRITIYDVFGFFQTSFVNALKQWNVGDAETVASISAMKDKRGTFTADDAAKVRGYCLSECLLLVQLMDRLIEAVNHAEIPCRQWYGVGALASGLMQKYSVKPHIVPAPESMSEPILSAYFGGRFEIAGSGHYGHVYTYDIKSAYPSVARSLPCLAHTSFEHVTRYRADRVALWHVRWDVPPTRFGPFPWRSDSRRIHYPLNGEGWYWSSEVNAARRLFGAKAIRILDGYILQTDCQDAPFSFINDVYAVRQAYEAKGDFAHKALKLSLNALYGKTAQSIGGKRVPPYQSFIWAGMITAGTRAVILDAFRQGRGDVISIATDGIVSRVPMDLPIGKALGQWDSGEYANAFLVASGIYRLTATTHDVGTHPKDGCIEHSRGFGLKETSFDAIEKDFAINPLGRHDYSATRFVGAASALASPRYKDMWRRWITAKRTINFVGASRFIVDHNAALAGIEPIWTAPPRFPYAMMSAPYTPKQTWMESWLDDVDILLDMDMP